jgi:hypothetical protein
MCNIVHFFWGPHTNNYCCLIWFWTWPESSPQVQSFPIFAEPLVFAIYYCCLILFETWSVSSNKIDLFKIGLISKTLSFKFSMLFISWNFLIFWEFSHYFFVYFTKIGFAEISRNNIKINNFIIIITKGNFCAQFLTAKFRFHPNRWPLVWWAVAV